jgi:mRNA interferase MazF
VRRGDVFFVDLDPVRGREQGGRRPVVVVSADALNALPLVVTAVVGTDAENVTRPYRTNVLVRASESGLPLDTVFLCFHLRSLDPRRFREPPAGRVPPSRMREIDAALRHVLALGA